MRQMQPILTARRLRNDSHTPPQGWNYDTIGPWRCDRRGCAVSFTSHAAYLAAHNACRSAKADKTADGKKLTSARAAEYAALHPSQQVEFEPPCTDMDMEDIIIDPLHCLLLNLPKVIWKYCWGDRMTNEQRELVAEYLISIGCPPDVRAKGDGRDANNKWFSGEAFAWFCEGSDTSPGLAQNVAEIMDIIYRKCPAPAPSATATPSDPPTANRSKKSGGGGAKKRAGGFSAFEPPLADAATATAPPPPSKPDSPLEAKLRVRYGSHMDVVLLGLNAWSVFASVYTEWRSEWTERSVAYAQERALTFLRHACVLSTAMKALSIGKHKSW